MSEITSSIELVTPELAKEWLATSIKNRKISQTKVIEYALAMKNGRWSVNSQGIGFDRNGHLENGHHRLLACIKCDYAFNTIVVRGLPPDSFETEDIGKKRSGSDVLGLENYVNTSNLASALKWLKMIRENRFHSPSIPNYELLEMAKAEPDMRRSLELASRAKAVIPPGPAGALHFLFAQKYVHDADVFFDKLATGQGLEEHSPILRLRESLIRDKGMRRQKTSPTTVVKAIRAWNAFRKGDKLYNLKGTVSSNEYPEIE